MSVTNNIVYFVHFFTFSKKILNIYNYRYLTNFVDFIFSFNCICANYVSVLHVFSIYYNCRVLDVSLD